MEAFCTGQPCGRKTCTKPHMDMYASKVKCWGNVFTGITCALVLAACTNRLSTTDSPEDLLHSGDKLAHAQYLEANKSMVELHNRGAVYDDDASRKLIDRVLKRLFPGEHNNPVRVTLARLPGENAYALPSGDIVLHQSMLAALSSEAQLAFVLAHESAHVFLNHAWLSANHRSKRRAAAHLTDLLLLGNSRSYGYFASSVEAYSRQQEYDADDYAARILTQAGYDLDDAAGFFEVLQRYPMVYEADASQRTHPGISDRRQRLEQLTQLLVTDTPVLAAAVGDETLQQAQQFNSHRSRVLDRSIRDKIGEHDLPGALLQIDELESLNGETASTDCLRGELYTAIASDVEEAGKAIREIFPPHQSAEEPGVEHQRTVTQGSASVFFLKQAQSIYENRLLHDEQTACAEHGLLQVKTRLERPEDAALLRQQALPGLHAQQTGSR